MKRDRWAMIYSPFDFDLTTNCYQMLQKAQGRFGIQVDEPQWIELQKGMDREPHGKGYIDAIKADLYPQETLIAVVILQRRDYKAPIKKVLD